MSASRLESKMVSVTLSSQSDWHYWIEVIKSEALTSEVWEFIDLVRDNPQQPEKPVIPKPAVVRPGVESISNLSEPEKELFHIYMLEYSDKFSMYQRQKIGLNAMRAFI